MLLSSLGFRIGLSVVWGWSHDPWTYRFFPSEIAVFMMGSLSYVLYQRLATTRVLSTAAWPVAFALVAALFTYRVLPWTTWKPWPYLLAMALAAPFLFFLSKDSRLDRLLGDLSYPVYLVHALVIAGLRPFLSWLGAAELNGMIAVFLSTCCAWGLLMLVTRPVEELRKRSVSHFRGIMRGTA